MNVISPNGFDVGVRMNVHFDPWVIVRGSDGLGQQCWFGLFFSLNTEKKKKKEKKGGGGYGSNNGENSVYEVILLHIAIRRVQI